MADPKAPSCPWCGSENTDADYVDNGVGMQQCGPAGCLDCGAIEIGPYSDETYAKASEDERRVSWTAGERSPERPVQLVNLEGRIDGSRSSTA